MDAHTLQFTLARTGGTREGLTSVIPESWLPGAMLAGGIALVTLVMLRAWWKRRRRSRVRDRADAHLTGKERMERVRTQAASADAPAAAVQRLMVEAQELTRACTAQLDSRAAKLETLIEEANATIARLEAAHMGEDIQPAMRAASGPPSDDAMGRIGFPMDGRVQTRPSAIERSIEPQNSGLGDDPVAQRVMDLHRRGMSPVQIAQELGEQVGRVELMLALRRA